MKNRIWAACMALLLANISILFYVYGYSTSGEEKIAAQSISRVISAYAEPGANPISLVRAEDRCRFYAAEFCAPAQAQRHNVSTLFSRPLTLTTNDNTEAFYLKYLAARLRLIQATNEYAAFLDTTPSNDKYVRASAVFEQVAGHQVGLIVSNLNVLQDMALRDSDRVGNWVFTMGYLCNFFLIALTAFARKGTYNKGR